MKDLKYLVLYWHSGQVFQEMYVSSPYMAAHLVMELVGANGYHNDGDEVMVQVQVIKHDCDDCPFPNGDDVCA